MLVPVRAFFVYRMILLAHAKVIKLYGLVRKNKDCVINHTKPGRRIYGLRLHDLIIRKPVFVTGEDRKQIVGIRPVPGSEHAEIAAMFCRSDVKCHGLHKRLQIISGNRRIRCDPGQAVFIPPFTPDLRNSLISVPQMLPQKSDAFRIRDLAASPAQQRTIEHRIAGIVLPVYRLFEKTLCLLRKSQIHITQRVVVERVRCVVSGRSLIVRVIPSGLFPVNLQQNLLRLVKYINIILITQPG